MVNILTITFFCFASICGMAQDTTGYINDVKELYTSVKQLPSYQAQIAGVNQGAYMRLYKQLLLEKPKDRFDRFYKLSNLIVPLKDNHLYFSELPEFEFDYDQFKDPAFVQKYRSSPGFLNYPCVNTNLIVLAEKLAKKPKESVEGIYYYGNRYMTVGVYRTSKKDSLVGVVLNTKYLNWRAGQFAFILKEYAPDRFRAYAASVDKKAFGLLRNEKFIRGTLTETHYTKFPGRVDHVNVPGSEPFYQFKTLPGNVKYIRLGSFSSNDKRVALSQQFFDEMKDSLTSKNTIVDLRNNGGGGYKNSAKFINLLQHYALDGGRIYILINNRTVSDAEQFTVRLRGADNVAVLGENSAGMIAYGNNSGTVDTLSSKRFKLYITDMRDQRNYVKYEDVGVSPDVYLQPDLDWIKQVLAYIKKQ